MHCNRWEREIWRKWRPKFKWENLSAILLSDPLGFVVVMPWAELVTEEDIRREMPHDHYPAFHSEPKAADHGRVNGRVVVRYYGLPSADMAVPDRQRYETHEGPAQRLDLPA